MPVSELVKQQIAMLRWFDCDPYWKGYGNGKARLRKRYLSDAYRAQDELFVQPDL